MCIITILTTYPECGHDGLFDRFRVDRLCPVRATSKNHIRLRAPLGGPRSVGGPCPTCTRGLDHTILRDGYLGKLLAMPIKKSQLDNFEPFVVRYPWRELDGEDEDEDEDEDEEDEKAKEDEDEDVFEWME